MSADVEPPNVDRDVLSAADVPHECLIGERIVPA
jgi:hypothetical protein